MVEHSIDIRRKHRIIILVYHNSRIGPPKESLRERSAVIHLCLYFNVSLVRIKRESRHPLRTEHSLHLTAPNRLATILKLFDVAIGRQICAGTVMLWPVEFNSSGNPRSGQSHQSWFNYLVIVDKVAFFHLIICHLYTSSQFRKNHDFYILIFYKKRAIGLILLLITDFLHYRIRIYSARTPLIHSFL